MFSDPQHILSQVSISQGAVACDIGAGSGFYTLLLSSFVGDTGKVYAVDIQKELLTKVANEARSNKRYNVEVVWGDVEKIGGTKLRENFVDIVVVANILFQIGNKKNFITEVRRILKSTGILLFIDWTDSFNNLGPHADHIVTKEAAITLFTSNGFKVEKDIDAGAHHYGMIVRKN